MFTGDYFITKVQTRLEKRQLGPLIPHYIDDRRRELKSNCLMMATFHDVIQLTIRISSAIHCLRTLHIQITRPCMLNGTTFPLHPSLHRKHVSRRQFDSMEQCYQ